MSTRSIASLGAPIRLFHGEYRALLGKHRVTAAPPCSLVSPSWAPVSTAG
jgi:hypothetical protein